MSSLLHFLRKQTSLFTVLLSFDALMLLLHIFFGRQTTFLHLDFEQNLPTYYQSGKLIIFGATFFALGLSKKISWEIKNFLLPLSLFLVALGFDELLQIHENIYRIFELFDWLHPSKIVDASMKMGYRSSLWILYYIPFIILFVFWCGYWLRYFQSKMKKNAWLILLSSISIFAVLVCEILSSTGSYSDTAYFWLVTFEEFAEMILATTLIFVGARVIKRYSNQ